MVSIIQVNGTGRSVNVIQHKRLAFRRPTFVEPLLYIYLYICFWNIGPYAAVDFSCDMTYSGADTMLHLAELVQPLIRPPPSHKCCLMPLQIIIQDVEHFQALQNVRGDIGDIKRRFINLSLHCLREKEHVKTTHF